MAEHGELTVNITLSGKSFPLTPPSGMASLDVRLSFPGLQAEDRLRLLRWAFGVVGMCWASKKLGWPDLASVKHDVLSLGEQVYQGLCAEGLVKDDDDAASVVTAALEILGAVSPTAKQVDEARDFSSPPSGGTSGEVAPRA